MITNPVKAIGAFCLSCCGDSIVARKECSAPDCVLYPFRFGKNPYRVQREASEAQLEARNKGLHRMQEVRAHRRATPEIQEAAHE